MVFSGDSRKATLAACCKVEVMNGGGGRRSRWCLSTASTVSRVTLATASATAWSSHKVWPFSR